MRAGNAFSLWLGNSPSPSRLAPRQKAPLSKKVESQTVEKPKRRAKLFRISIVPGGVYGGDARRPRAVREAARSKSVEAPKGWRGEGRAAFVRPISLREKGGFWAGLLHTVVPLTKRLPFPKGELAAKPTEGFPVVCQSPSRLAPLFTLLRVPAFQHHHCDGGIQRLDQFFGGKRTRQVLRDLL